MTPLQKYALQRIAATVTIVATVFVPGATGVLKDFLADDDAPAPPAEKTIATASSEPSIPSWKPWLAEMSGIWSDGQTQTRIFFSPKGILIEDMAAADASLKLEPMRPTIKGTDDENDIVVLAANIALSGDFARNIEAVAKLSGKQIPTTTEIVLRRIWNEAHSQFTLQWTGGGGGPERLGFVRRFLPEELTELAALVSASAQAPTRTEATASLPASTTINQDPTTDGQQHVFQYVQDGVNGELDIIRQNDGRLDAKLGTVTKSDYHTCEFDMSGLTKRKGFGWEWKDDDTSCHIEIGGSSSALEVHGSKECYSSCGMNGAFEGSYKAQQKTNR